MKLNDKNALIEDSEGNQYLRNKVHLKKYKFSKDTQWQLVDCQSYKEDIELLYTLPDKSTPNTVPSISREMRNEIDFPSAPGNQQKTIQPKAIEKHSGVTKIIEVTDI